MNISEFEKPASEKLAKINEALDTLYGFRVYDSIDIKVVRILFLYERINTGNTMR